VFSLLDEPQAELTTIADLAPKAEVVALIPAEMTSYIKEDVSAFVNEVQPVTNEIVSEETCFVTNESIDVTNEFAEEAFVFFKEETTEEVVEPVFEVEEEKQQITFEFDVTNNIVASEESIFVNSFEEPVSKVEPIIESKEENTFISKVQDDEQLKKAQDRVAKLKELSFKLKSPNGLSELENEPAYKRRNINLDSTPHSSESQVSRYTLSEGDDKKIEIKPNNSFLHDNVD
jgi:cell division protein FtsZ